MSYDPSFEGNCYTRWANCGSVMLAVICPLCQHEMLDPMGIPDEFMREQFDAHMLEHAKRGEPHEAVPP